MKQVKTITISAFAKLPDMPIASSKPSILTELDASLGDSEAGHFTLGWAEYGAIRRHIKFSERKKQKPRFEVKVLSFKGKGRNRQYELAIARNK